MYSDKEIELKAFKESGIDTDWFFRDKIGRVAVVASGGGLLPNSVATDMNGLKRTIDYFRYLPEIYNNDSVIENRVMESIRNSTVEQKNNYLKDLYYMTKRGIYYYDKSILNDYWDFSYYLKAKPTIPLQINFIIDSKNNILIPNLVENIEKILTFDVREFD